MSAGAMLVMGLVLTAVFGGVGAALAAAYWQERASRAAEHPKQDDGEERNA